MNNDLRRAYEAIERAIEHHPDDAEALEAAGQIGITIAGQASPDEAEALLEAGEFPSGSMGPKIRAALDFLAAGGEEVIITDPQHLSAALAGSTGTHIAVR